MWEVGKAVFCIWCWESLLTVLSLQLQTTCSNALCISSVFFSRSVLGRRESVTSLNQSQFVMCVDSRCVQGQVLVRFIWWPLQAWNGSRWVWPVIRMLWVFSFPRIMSKVVSAEWLMEVVDVWLQVKYAKAFHQFHYISVMFVVDCPRFVWVALKSPMIEARSGILKSLQ